jgi:biotin carboxyl carrier protein
MIYEVRGADGSRRIEVRRDGAGTLWVAVDGGEARAVCARRLTGVEWRVDSGRGERTVGVALAGERADVVLGGDPFRFELIDARRAALALGGGAAAGDVRTAMPGAVVRVLVGVGEAVAAGQPVIVVEAMKMENELRAPHAGVVTAIAVKAGEAVEAGALLVAIGAAE